MDIRVLLSILSLAPLLAGCASSRLVPEPRVNCGGGNGDSAVITIDMTNPARPVASPKECRVKQNRKIEWTTTANPPSTFDVRFTDDSADEGGAIVLRGIKKNNAGPAAPFVANIKNAREFKRGASNRYDYDIVVNGVVIDPSIIIDQ